MAVVKKKNILPMIVVIKSGGFKNLWLFHGEILGSSMIFWFQWMLELIELYRDKIDFPLLNLLYCVQYKPSEVSSLFFLFLKIFLVV